MMVRVAEITPIFSSHSDSYRPALTRNCFDTRRLSYSDTDSCFDTRRLSYSDTDSSSDTDSLRTPTPISRRLSYSDTDSHLGLG